MKFKSLTVELYQLRDKSYGAAVVQHDTGSGISHYGAPLLPRSVMSYTLAIKMVLKKLQQETDHVLFQFSETLLESVPEMRNLPRLWRVDFQVPETIQ